MAPTPRSTLGSLLRQFRLEAALTQEELAERAEISVRAVSDLERGVNTAPRPFTIRRLADALGLTSEERAAFQRASIIPPGSAESRADSQPRGRFLGSLPEFELVGREAEVRRISAILDAVAEGVGHLVLLVGEPGSGKTRLLQELTVQAGERGYVVLLRLHPPPRHCGGARTIKQTRPSSHRTSISMKPAREPLGRPGASI
jgi:transcriptional regulator with XRE-family HTH domain